MEQKERILEQLIKYLDKSATTAEREELMQWIYEAKNDEDLYLLLEESWRGREVVFWQRPEKADLIFNLIIHKREEDARGRHELLQPVFEGHISGSASGVVSIQRSSWKRYLVAAAVILAIATTTFLWVNRKQEPSLAAQTQRGQGLQNDVLPGSDKAILTLADGKKIILDSTTGNIAREGGVTIINMAGQLSYESSGNRQPSTINYNTINTPRGGQYQIVLADGTKVWLNAASSLRFPTAFQGKDRVVELTGEGYFEVAHNASKPFHVRVGEMDVQVLGTHFNINSYEDEYAIRTTLLEGSVKVTLPGFSKTTGRYQVLKPGEQAVVKGRDLKLNTAVDTEQVMAWKNNLFVFTGNKIQAVMRQVARWYDVDIRYVGPVTDEDFVGYVSRYENVSQLLMMMEKTGKVKFEIQEKTIFVMNP